MDHLEKAFVFAADLSKQLISLSTAVIALTITFLKDVLGWKDAAPIKALRGTTLLWSGWGSMLLSVAAGLMMLMALTGELEPKTPAGRNPSIRKANVVGPSIVQILSFVLGLGLLVGFAILNL